MGWISEIARKSYVYLTLFQKYLGKQKLGVRRWMMVYGCFLGRSESDVPWGRLESLYVALTSIKPVLLGSGKMSNAVSLVIYITTLTFKRLNEVAI